MRLAGYDAVLCDLDGCLVSGATILPGAVELVEATQHKLCIVSNNSTDTRESLVGRLRALGLTIDLERVYLAGVLAVDQLANIEGCRLHMLANQRMCEYARQRGIELDEQNPSHVLLTRGAELNCDTVVSVVNQIEDGALLTVSNPDLSHPGANGRPVPETGAWLEVLRACLPNLTYRIVGKPHVDLFTAALGDLGVDAARAVVVGDNPITDGRGAQNTGCDFFHVTSTLADVL